MSWKWHSFKSVVVHFCLLIILFGKFSWADKSADEANERAASETLDGRPYTGGRVDHLHGFKPERSPHQDGYETQAGWRIDYSVLTTLETINPHRGNTKLSGFLYLLSRNLNYPLGLKRSLVAPVLSLDALRVEFWPETFIPGENSALVLSGIEQDIRYIFERKSQVKIPDTPNRWGILVELQLKLNAHKYCPSSAFYVPPNLMPECYHVTSALGNYEEQTDLHGAKGMLNTSLIDVVAAEGRRKPVQLSLCKRLLGMMSDYPPLSFVEAKLRTLRSLPRSGRTGESEGGPWEGFPNW